MPTLLTASEVLDRELLAMRAKLIELGAFLDRLDRAAGSVADDPRLEKIRQSLQLLAGDAPDRAEKIQLLFSLSYRENWRKQYGL